MVCQCALCPTRSSKVVVPRDIMSRMEKGLVSGHMTLNPIGELVQGEMNLDNELYSQQMDTLGSPSQPSCPIGIKALLALMSMEFRSTMSLAQANERTTELLAAYYSISKRSKDSLDRLCIQAPDTGEPVTVLEIMVKQLSQSGPKEKVLVLLRKLVRDDKSRKRLSCLMWRKDKKTRQYESVNGLIAILVAKHKGSQENAARVLAALASSREKIERLCKTKMIIKALAKTVESGSVKARDTAIWILWLLTEEDDCCNKLGTLENTINALIEIAATQPEDEEHCNTRGNALAVLANLAVYENNCLTRGAKPQAFEAAAAAVNEGSEREVEKASVLIGNMAFDENMFPHLANLDLDMERLCSLCLHGDDRGKESGTLAISNLCRMENFTRRLLKCDGALELLRTLRQHGKTERTRVAAERAIANVGILRLRGSGAKIPVTRNKTIGFSSLSLPSPEKIVRVKAICSETSFLSNSFSE